jgi:pullulanase/glycogen debranching enzyme
MVKAFHRENIAVIMDVVYNHVSNYDYHPFKYIDREMYFRLNPKGNYVAHSGCGNDTRTEHSTMQKLILESVKYWMTEYHVDGFRFDLGNLIDPATRELIIAELKTLNPNVIILAEPWGNGYDPVGFSEMGWASFNDQFRNGVKGQNPVDGLGFIFGSWQGKNSQKSLQRYVTGSLTQSGGQYINVAHSVNYLESHDDHTLGDFIRIGSGHVDENDRISDRLKNSLVENDQLTLNKLAALFLLTSQGTTFLHAGQEWARSKVISDTNVPDKKIGKIDHNSYEKDNETNWLNWNEQEMNLELVDYYKGLIELRKQYSEFRHSKPEDFEFMDVGEKVAVAYILKDRFVVILNGENEDTLELDIPAGQWNILADEKLVNLEDQQLVSNKISVPPSSGIVLKWK